MTLLAARRVLKLRLVTSRHDFSHFPCLEGEKHIIGPGEHCSVIHSGFGMVLQMVIAKEPEEAAGSAKPIDLDAVDGAMDLGPQVGIDKAPRQQGGGGNQNAAQWSD